MSLRLKVLSLDLNNLIYGVQTKLKTCKAKYSNFNKGQQIAQEKDSFLRELVIDENRYVLDHYVFRLQQGYGKTNLQL